MNLNIEHVGQYTRPETYQQTTELCHIGLGLTGLDYMRLFVPGCDAPQELSGADLPWFTLLPPGVRIDFRFGRHRENWVIQCRLPELELEPGEFRSRFLSEGVSLPVPLVHSLRMEDALEYRERFRRIRASWQGGTPADRLAAGLSSAGILGELFAGKFRENEEPETPAARFRAAIDGDVRFRKTLAELSREAGASPGYLRKCFREAYRIEPAEYRARRRMGRIIELIGRSTFGFKEIAEEVGMRHVTHLNAFVREHCGATPGELRKSRRGI